MEQTLVVKGNIYSVIKDENEVPARVSRLKNNLTDLGRFLFGAWTIKHVNYYVAGADTDIHISGIMIGADNSSPTRKVLVIIPQISAIVLGSVGTFSFTNSVGPYYSGGGYYSSSSTGYEGNYDLGSCGTTLLLEQVFSVAWMGVKRAPDSSDPTISGIAYLNITQGGGSVTVTIKGYYSFSANTSSSYLTLAVDGRRVPLSAVNETADIIPVNTYVTDATDGPKTSWAIFKRTFSASFTSGQSIRVAWQVNISGS